MIVSIDFLNPENPDENPDHDFYRQVADSPLPGRALRRVQADDQGRILDIVLGLEDIGCFGILVLPGNYYRENQDWFLDEDQAPQAVANPIEQVRRAALGIHSMIEAALAITVFVVPVLIFPDMARDPDIDTWAERCKVRVLWGPENLLERLVALTRDGATRIFYPPTAEEIEEVAEVLDSSLVRPGPTRAALGPPAAPGDSRPDPAAESAPATEPPATIHIHIHIQSLETLNLFLTPEALEKLQLPRPSGNA